MGAGGCPDFNGLTQFSIHLLINPGKLNNTYMQWFGYAHSQAWGTGFADLVVSANNASLGYWSGPNLTNQTMNNSTPTIAGQGYFTPNTWQLMSVTCDLTTTTNSTNVYKNGVLVGTIGTNVTGSLAFGSAGYWFVGNPGSTPGDTGDNYQGLIAMARFEKGIRSQAYIQAMWNSIFPESSSWPFP